MLLDIRAARKAARADEGEGAGATHSAVIKS
jgi:hypothetical protein